MPSQETERAIAQSFIDLLDEKPLSRISVSDIVSASSKNRKTFYYHFHDKNALIVWIFRNDMADELRRDFPESELVFPDDEDDPYPRLPYYTFVKEGVRQLDGSGFLHALDEVFTRRRTFYRQVLADTSQDGLSAYLYRLYAPAIQHDIEFVLSNRYLPNENLRFLTEFHTGAILSYYIRKVRSSNPEEFGKIGPFENIVEDSIAHEIAKQQRSRTL